MGRGDYLGEFEQIVLLAVARLGDESYGMEIRREIEARTGRAVSIGAVYATMDRLDAKGYVSSHDEGSAGRARRFFALTATGVDALETARAVQQKMWAGLRLKREGRQR